MVKYTLIYPCISTVGREYESMQHGWTLKPVSKWGDDFSENCLLWIAFYKPALGPVCDQVNNVLWGHLESCAHFVYMLCT